MARQLFLKPQGKWTIGLVVGTALTVAGIGVWQLTQLNASKASTEPEPTPTVTPKASDIAALGRIEPQGDVIKVGGPSGERILRLRVKEGDTVRVNQILAYLESYPERLAARDLAAVRLKEALDVQRSDETLGVAEIRAAQTREAQVTRPIREQMQAQVATIRRLEVERTRAQRDYQRFKTLQAGGAASKKDLEDRLLTFQSRTLELNNAIASLRELEQKEKTDKSNARAQIEMAQAGLQRSRVRARVASAQSELDLANIQLERTVITAPQAGQILDILIKEGEAISVGGGQGGSGESTILELGDTRNMVVVAEVYETDVGKVKLGQSATIKSPAVEGKLHGKVEKIGLQIGKKDVLDTDPTADTDARVVEVEIGLLNGAPVSKLTNLQVDVVIHPDAE